MWWVSIARGDSNNKKKSTAAGGARCVKANVNGEHPTGFWWCSLAQMRMRQLFSERNAPMLLANQPRDGDSPIQDIVTSLQERSRKFTMDGLRECKRG